MTRLRCPCCGKDARLLPNADGTYLRPGEFVLCVGCFVWFVLTRTLQLRVLSNGEWATLNLDERKSLTRYRDQLRDHYGQLEQRTAAAFERRQKDARVDVAARSESE